MREIEFIKYKDTNRFNEDYPLIEKFFIENTGDGLMENWHIGRLDWMLNHEYTNPELLPMIGMWKDQEEVVGVVIFDVEYPPIYFLCKKGYETLYDVMYEYALKTFPTDKWCEKGNWIKTVIKDENKTLLDFLESKGFVKDGWPENIIELQCNPVTKFEYNLPEGFSITSFDEEKDYEKYSQLLFKGFDHEGEDESEAGKTYKTTPFEEPNWNDKLKVLVKAPDGEWASHCGIWYIPGTTTAYIEPVVTIPKYRKMSLAKAAIYEAVNRCSELGAKRSIVISDMDFYFSLGFKQSSNYYHMAKYLE